MDKKEESCGEEGGGSHEGWWSRWSCGREAWKLGPQVPDVQDDDEAEPIAPILWEYFAMIYVEVSAA